MSAFQFYPDLGDPIPGLTGPSLGTYIIQANTQTLVMDAPIINPSFTQVKIATNAGLTGQGNNSIALGFGAGQNNQGAFSVAIGFNSGCTGQAGNALALGRACGAINQGVGSMAFGLNAGFAYQSTEAISIGSTSGFTGQGSYGIAIGAAAGNRAQKTNAVALGRQAGYDTQGANSVAIGYLAGYSGQHANTIILNSSGQVLNSDRTDAFFMAPIRNTGTSSQLYYNTTTKEITYGPAASAGASGTLPSGGLTNQILAKQSNTDFNTLWSSTFTGTSAYLSSFVDAPTINPYQTQVKIATNAGLTGQGINSIAIGREAGNLNQANGIAIGSFAGQFNQ